MNSEQEKKRVLICDDDEISRSTLVRKVVKIGYEVVGQATTGIEAMNQFIERNPNIILLDIKMPLGSGLTVLSFIRDISPSAIVVMITGDQHFSNSKTVVKCLQIGANDYLIKGKFDEDRLQKAIEKDQDKHEDVKTVTKQDIKELFDIDQWHI